MTTKEAVLSALKNNKGTFISGEELSNKLNISRTAVWKSVRSLREDGYPIEAVTKKGYMLTQDGWLITEENLRLHLPGRYKNNRIRVYDTLDSTNDEAKRMALSGTPHGTVVMARQQTGGKGRLGRSFFSPREGIYITVVIKPSFDMSKSMLVTSAAAVAVAESIEEVCGRSPGIKWVNDVYLDEKKICGILTEGITDFESGRIEYLVIGIGVNTDCRNFPAELLDKVGAVEGDYSKSELSAAIITRTLDLTASLDDSSFMERYRKRSIVLGKTVNIYKGTYKTDPSDEIPSRVARVMGIDDRGGLEVLYTDGARETLTSGEISIRL